LGESGQGGKRFRLSTVCSKSSDVDPLRKKGLAMNGYMLFINAS